MRGDSGQVEILPYCCHFSLIPNPRTYKLATDSGDTRYSVVGFEFTCQPRKRVRAERDGSPVDPWTAEVASNSQCVGGQTSFFLWLLKSQLKTWSDTGSYLCPLSFPSELFNFENLFQLMWFKGFCNNRTVFIQIMQHWHKLSLLEQTFQGNL